MLQVSQCERMVDTALVQVPLNVKCTRPPPLSLVIHRPWPPVRQRVVGLPEKLEQHCVVHQNVWELHGGAQEWVPGLDPLAAPLHQVRGTMHRLALEEHAVALGAQCCGSACLEVHRKC